MVLYIKHFTIYITVFSKFKHSFTYGKFWFMSFVLGFNKKNKSLIQQQK